jgi:plastocyanin
MKNKILIGIFVVVVVALGAWYLWGTTPILEQNGETPQEEAMENGSNTTNNTENSRPVRTFEDGHYVTFVYFDGASFSPETVTIDHGESVRFVNLSTLAMRVGTRAEHLSSGSYSGIDQPNAGSEGTTYDVFFSTPGTWAFENLPSSATGIYGTVNVR